jgi:hypothetical protein
MLETYSVINIQKKYFFLFAPQIWKTLRVNLAGIIITRTWYRFDQPGSGFHFVASRRVS